VFSLPFLLQHNYDDRMQSDPESRSFVYVSALTWVLWVLCFYLNAFVLTPKVIYQRKYVLYVLIVISVYAIVMLIHWRLFETFIAARPFRLANGIMFNLAPYFLVIAASIAYKVLSDKNRSDRLSQAARQETLKTELSFLRSQISPHFVFNILNNITALARMKSDELEPTVMKLSSLLRYMLYETNEEKVSLQTEVDYLRDYIDLQQQRFGKKVAITTSLEAINTSAAIEPMLLIPFVENAFKHGVGMIADPHINISLGVINNVLNFTVENKYLEASGEIKDKTSGIGLANVQRRLDLLYDRNAILDIKKDNDWYRVNLQLNLH